MLAPRGLHWHGPDWIDDGPIAGSEKWNELVVAPAGEEDDGSSWGDQLLSSSAEGVAIAAAVDFINEASNRRREAGPEAVSDPSVSQAITRLSSMVIGARESVDGSIAEYAYTGLVWSVDYLRSLGIDAS